MPAATWLELCRHAENDQKWEEAAADYERLANTWPRERQSVLALISAGRICLRQLGRREDAARLYKAADASPVPHSDWNETIRRGLEHAAGTAPAEPMGASPSKVGT